MTSNIVPSIIKSYQGKSIRIREDKYVCLTDMAVAASKLFADWARLKGTTAYLEALSEAMGIPISLLLEVEHGNTTWAHPRVAIKFAAWCSPAFEVQITTWIDELLTTGSVSIAPQRQLPPVRDTIEYIEALELCGLMNDPMIRSLITQRVCEELTAGSNTRSLPAPEQPLNVTSIASNLGFSQQAIGNGSALGKYIASRHQPLGTSQHGKYQVNVYLPSEVESSIEAFFSPVLA